MNAIGPIDSSKIQAMAEQLKAMAAQARAPSSPVDATAESGTAEPVAAPIDFGSVLKASLDRVNDIQHTAGDLADRFTKGDDSVSLSEVMIAGQKANIALQATIQVKSKLVAAYNDIMNMQI
ncbi:MAG: flagellar hook-basal body complex protein FliE [Burkholderiaceae bacterium]|nr:flagellar hook-basal body complex protein FliE [Burkholderiaceae bacterium]